MPEAEDFIETQCNEADWDNANRRSGTGVLGRRPYYYRIVGSGEEPKILIISAVVRNRKLHATDYLRLDRQSFARLTNIAGAVFGIPKFPS